MGATGRKAGQGKTLTFLTKREAVFYEWNGYTATPFDTHTVYNALVGKAG